MSTNFYIFILKQLKSEMHMISFLFSWSVNTASSDVQLELIDLKSNKLLSEHLKLESLVNFYSLKEESFPDLRNHGSDDDGSL